MGSFMNQANALLRKNLTFQKRNLKTNLCLVAFPILICVLLAGLQRALDKASEKANADLDCTNQEFFTDPPVCPIRSPPKWPALLHLPFNKDRAVKTRFTPFADLPDDSCRKNGSCPVTILLTGGNHSLGQSMAGNLYPSLISFNISGNSSSDILEALSNVVLGSPKFLVTSNLLESTQNWSIIQPKCPPTFGLSVAFNVLNHIMEKDITCVEGLHLWRNNSSVINDELFKGHSQGNPESRTNEILAAYDFLNSNDQNFNVNIWYNLIYRGSKYLLRVPRLVNMVSNSYLQFVRGAGFKILIDFVMEMPKPAVTREDIELTTYLGPIFFTWVILQLFPVVLKSLVYEKQQNLRIMMKMHGLGDGPYWIISYAYFFFISSAYMLCFMLFGSLIGLKLFRLNDYTIQFVFYFIYVNLQIAFAFLVATIFSNVKTASVIAQIFVLASGLFGQFLFRSFIEDESAPRVLIIVLEIFPAFSLYRGLYEFVQFSSGTFQGMQWKDLNYNAVGMRNVMFIMLIEWFIVLFFGYYLDQVVTVGSGVRRHPLFFLQNLRKKPSSSLRMPSLQREARVVIQMERPDVFQEMEKVEQLLLEPNASHAVICNHIKKVYPGMDGNPDKVAVRGLSLALPRGECFGMLGPNGAGKTSFISMMIGLTNPSSGTAFVQGLDIRTDMDKIYTSMGVCPQHDLLWETLTGREHLHFYGRLKNLEGSALTRAVDESLKSVNLFHGGVGDKQAGKYSGGMKRKLSVAISLIGDPKVVYMDEPSTGLDPASRKYLWNVVKRSKKDRAIILTTHSMEEAEVLCDRLGIFVDGSLQCIGNPKELKGRYGGSYVFTMTTSSSHEEDVENLAYHLCPDAKKIYHISGTQKFELPKEGVRIVDVFRAVQNAKRNFQVQAWGLADTTLEDVFIKVAAGAQAFNVLS